MDPRANVGVASMLSSHDFFYGWDLLFATIRNDVNKKSDLLIALVHFLLTKHNKARCVGIGDDKTLPEDGAGSELLPEGWNGDETRYSIRYVYNKTLYLVLGHITEGALIVNLLDTKTNKVTNITVNPETLVADMSGPLNMLMPTAAEIIDRCDRELLDPVFNGNERPAPRQSNEPQRPLGMTPMPDPLLIGEPRRPGQFMPNGAFEPHPFGFPDVGRGDLDPLARGGPGNLFTFPHPARPHPNGAIPQPRFDPFGPLDPQIPNRGINPDHLRPPSWNNDYYM